jgi:hypothetical protein
VPAAEGGLARASCSGTSAFGAPQRSVAAEIETVVTGKPIALLDAVRAFVLRWFVAIVGTLGLVCYLGIYASHPNLAPISSDGYSYYVYLPSWFLYHDTTLESVADDCCGGTYPSFTAISRWPRTRRWVNAHPIGEAVLMAPFFGAAHALTRWSNLPADGFSLYYQHAAGLAGLVYMLGGLHILRGLLRRHYSKGVTLATLAVLTWGTDLFHYGTYDAVYSHAYSFCLVCALSALTERWWEAPGWRSSVLLALVGGLIVLVRHPNALFLVLVPLYGVGGSRDLATRVAALGERRATVGGMALVGALCLVPQLALYRQATGSWLVSAYGQLGFAYRWSPKIAEVLIGVRKGLFFWSPALVFAVAGMVRPDMWSRRWRLAAIGILAVQIWMVASWYDWQFGGSFGHRGFTDGLALFAPFLAAFFAWSSRRHWLKVAVSTTVTLAVALSVFQMWQYWVGILPISDTTWEQYKSLFLRIQ